jgi:hypothetical protein
MPKLALGLHGGRAAENPEMTGDRLICLQVLISAAFKT